MVQMSMVKRSREAKKNAAISVIAMKLAKDNADMQWKKAAKFKKLFVAAKRAVAMKYGPRAKVEWMKQQTAIKEPAKAKTK